jgi:hypothetical protein
MVFVTVRLLHRRFRIRPLPKFTPYRSANGAHALPRFLLFLIPQSFLAELSISRLCYVLSYYRTASPAHILKALSANIFDGMPWNNLGILQEQLTQNRRTCATAFEFPPVVPASSTLRQPVIMLLAVLLLASSATAVPLASSFASTLAGLHGKLTFDAHGNFKVRSR